jgi:hypothetical protein
VNLQLPPARRLPNADRMVDEIIRADRDQQQTPVRRGPWLALAAAAVIAGVAVGVFVTVRGPFVQGPIGVPTSSSPQLPATPRPTPTPTPTTSPTRTPTLSSPPATTTPPPSGPLALGETAKFENFEVTVTQVSSYVDRSTARAKVCVRKLPPNPTGQTTRVSIDPWTIVVGEQSLSARKPAERSPSDYPVETFLRVGQCVQGWIEFPAVPKARLQTVRYHNYLDDRTEWVVPR